MNDELIKALKKCYTMKPKDAIDYLKSMKIEVNWDWKKQLEIISRHCFTVAKVTTADILQDILDELVVALEDGKRFSEFKEELQTKLADKGWSHVNGSAWRLDTIYRTNMQSAYMAGRYYQMKEITEDFPYWQYLAVLDVRTRPEHAKMHGKVIRADDKFWNVGYPPSGYNCFPGATLIATPVGWKRIDSLIVGQQVIGGSGKNRLVNFIHHNLFNGNFIRLTVEEGRSVTTTPNHRILTLKGWIMAKNIKPGDVIVNILPHSSFDDGVHDVYHRDTNKTQVAMTLPMHTPDTAGTNTFNTKVDFVEENINPIPTNRIVVNDTHTQVLLKMINHCRLACRRLGIVIRMYRRIVKLSFLQRLANLRSNIRSSGRCSLFKPQRFLSLLRANFFRSTKPVMKTISVSLLGHLGHPLPSFATSNICVEPLSFDSIAAVSGINSKIPEKFQDCVIAHTPSGTQLSDSLLPDNVEVEEGFTSGAPLNDFDSLDSFVAYATSHYYLSKVVDVSATNIQNNTDIYNLFVDEDESYITQIGVVHNCRCRTRALSEAEIERKKLKVTSGDKVNFKPDEGFDNNPAAEWKPDMTKYDTSIRKSLKKVLSQ